MSNNYPNPDYPTAGSFITNTYQQPVQGVNEMFYYNGGAVNPFNPMQPVNDYDSRRNNNVAGYGNPTMYPQIPGTTPFAYQPQGQQSVASPPSVMGQQPPHIQPFSSYPPATPQGQPNIPFNSMIDSRRNTNAGLNQNLNGNPWAQQNVPPQHVMPGQMPNVQQQQMFDMASMMAGQIEPMVRALYANNNINTIDRSVSPWENQYTSPQQIQQPVVDWRQQTPQYQQPQQMMYGYQQPMMPANPFPAVQATWKEIAEQNWKNQP